MSLIVKFTVELDRINRRFILVETTGNYSSSNLEGWGTPNPTRGSILSSGVPVVFKVTYPDGSIETFNATDQFKLGTLTAIYNSSKEVFIDGVYTFEVTVNYAVPAVPGGAEGYNTSVNTTITQTEVFEIFKDIHNYIAERIDLTSFPSCDCNENILTLWSYVQALKAAHYNQNEVQLTFIHEQVNRIIKNG